MLLAENVIKFRIRLNLVTHNVIKVTTVAKTNCHLLLHGGFVII
jgi:hypothetical protein